MPNSTPLLTVLSLATILSQPAFAAGMYNVKEMSACVPVGEIAMKMIDLRESGHEREFIETTMKKHLDRNLALWVSPIAKLVMAEPEKPNEKVIKQALGYCLRTMKKHKRIEKYNKPDTPLYDT